MAPQNSNQIEWTSLNKSDEARFAPQLKAGLKWLLELLDETERARKSPRTIYDQPVNERMRRAS
jgi:hypothetical protein